MEDHRHLSRQLGRMSYIVSDPDDVRWQHYISELDAAARELHLLCKSLCKPVDKSHIDGFQKIWNVSLYIYIFELIGWAKMIHVKKVLWL